MSQLHDIAGITDIVCARVRLRPMCAGDEALYLALYGDASVMRHVAAPMPRARAAASFRRDLARPAARPQVASRWIVAMPGAEAGIGLVGLVPDADGPAAEIGILLLPRMQGQGIAGQALSLMARTVSERAWAGALWARHRPANRAMGCVLARLGFERASETAEEVRWRWLVGRHGAGHWPREAPMPRLGTPAGVG